MSTGMLNNGRCVWQHSNNLAEICALWACNYVFCHDFVWYDEHLGRMYHQVGRLWTAGWLWTIVQHLCFVSVKGISRWNISYCEVWLPIFMTWLLHCDIFYRDNTEVLKNFPKSPQMTVSKMNNFHLGSCFRW